jgi:hypothetical protein
LLRRLAPILRRLLPAARPPRPAAARKSFRPRVEAVEDRIVLDSYRWVGNGPDSNWSTLTNWLQDEAAATRAPGALPGVRDAVVLADTTGPQKHSVMDLPSTPADPVEIGELHVGDGYADTLTLRGALAVGRLVQENGTIAVGPAAPLVIDGPSSVWRGGNWAGGPVWVRGGLAIEPDGGRTPRLEGASVRIDAGGGVSWNAGDVDVAPGPGGVQSDITNFGQVTILSDGRMGHESAAWVFANVGGGQTVKRGPGAATLLGVHYLDGAGGRTVIEAGTLTRTAPPALTPPAFWVSVAYVQAPGGTLSINAGAAVTDSGLVLLHGDTTVAGHFTIVGDGVVAGFAASAAQF